MLSKKNVRISAVYTGMSACFLFCPCLIKIFSGYSCPACGTRRAIVAALKGNFIESFFINPYGIFFMLSALSFATVFLYGKLIHSNSSSRLYKRLEDILSHKIVIIFFIVLMFTNWIWNIQKGM
ncbi:hypothetical protein EZS27_026175 [termite gut metagenome]|uniref:DUF2752 domain-containing protein n=1 Tax=termite gut metagenome TaxID=433724 RepID=A0A5J4QRM0_9ZZZZ